jgi:hypothetical protein
MRAKIYRIPLWRHKICAGDYWQESVMERTNQLKRNNRNFRLSIIFSALIVPVLLTIWNGNLNPGLTYLSVRAATDNTAPVLQVNMPLRLDDVPEESLNPPGNTVAQILASGGENVITDVDDDDKEGVAVVTVNDMNGEWQFSLNPPLKRGI